MIDEFVIGYPSSWVLLVRLNDLSNEFTRLTNNIARQNCFGQALEVISAGNKGPRFFNL